MTDPFPRGESLEVMNHTLKEMGRDLPWHDRQTGRWGRVSVYFLVAVMFAGVLDYMSAGWYIPFAVLFWAYLGAGWVWTARLVADSFRHRRTCVFLQLERATKRAR